LPSSEKKKKRFVELDLGVIQAREAVDAASTGSFLLESFVVFFKGGYAALDLMVWVGRELYLDGFEADTEVLELVIVLLQFLLSAGGRHQYGKLWCMK
jgi:hypothetical protein